MKNPYYNSYYDASLSDSDREKLKIEQKLIEDLANLFGEKQNMSQMDAADFVDSSSEIWDLRQRAKEIVKSHQ